MSVSPAADLQHVQTLLQQHRQQRGRQRIPDTIRQQVVEVSKRYPRKQIIDTLSISYKMLGCWEREAPYPCSPPSASAEPAGEALTFVSLPLNTASGPNTDSGSDEQHAGAVLELQLADGVQLRFNGVSASAQCLQLLQGVGYGRAQPLADQAVSS